MVSSAVTRTVDHGPAWMSIPTGSICSCARPKGCFYSNSSGQGLQHCAFENQTCSVPSVPNNSALVLYYGNQSLDLWTVRSGANIGSGFTCNNSYFGYDPTPGSAKECLYGISSGPAGWTTCAAEAFNASCNLHLQGRDWMTFGADVVYAAAWVQSISCGTGTFGWDPRPGVLKSCFSPNP